ncbi:MAG TPA: tetratricopeptide repeat protein [Candidatus Polarisedimenticolia bacterium]|nr:tetratricopeptide repeat protein [Candidatus Polarisedimenticolia bacterium]
MGSLSRKSGSTGAPRAGVRRLLLSAATALGAALLAARPATAQGFGGTVEDILARGDSYLQAQRANEAIAQFQEARTLCPTPAEMVSALEGEARGRMQNKEFLPAAGILEEAINRYPNDPRQPDLLYMAGMARNQGGDMAGSATLLRKALDANPTPDLLPALRFWLARSLRLDGKPKEVVDLLNTFEKDFPKNQLTARALYYLGLAQHDTGDLAASEATYRHLMEAYPHTQESSEALFELGQVLAARGVRDEAVQFLRTYANANPSSPVAARSMELAGDLMLFHSPKEASLYYGVAQVKSASNPAPGNPALVVSGWLGTKTTIARWLSDAWVLVALAVAAVALIAGIAWMVLRRRRASRGTAAPEPSNA